MDGETLNNTQTKNTNKTKENRNGGREYRKEEGGEGEKEREEATDAS